MLPSIVAIFAIAGLAFAAPPAQATYCYEDNLLRAFQHTPTPASQYCTTGAGYPTFLTVATYPATRISSACSCFTRFPVEPPSCTPPPTPSMFTFDAPGAFGIVEILLTIDRTQPCGNGGFKVVNMCGTIGGQPISYSTTTSFDFSDQCFFPGITSPDLGGVAFTTPSDTWNIYSNNGVIGIVDPASEQPGTGLGQPYPNQFQAACPGATCPS